MANDAFGFLDPADVLHGCHIIPAFTFGRKFSNDGDEDLSRLAKYTKDWTCYYISQ